MFEESFGEGILIDDFKRVEGFLIVKDLNINIFKVDLNMVVFDF